MGRFYFEKLMTIKRQLIPNVDYYINSDGCLTFTEKYHLERGYCCQSGCLHCPYKEKIDPNIPSEFRTSWSECHLSDEEE